jgi:hypothetical protein
MSEEIEKIVEQAVAPLRNDIAQLKVQVALFLASAPGHQELPAPVKEPQELLKTIPQETSAALNAVSLQFAGKTCWFSLGRQDGNSISIKNREYGFRLRVRDHGGALLKELTPSASGLSPRSAAHCPSLISLILPETPSPCSHPPSSRCLRSRVRNPSWHTMRPDVAV